MQFDISFPLHFKATLRRGGERDVYIADSHRADFPEVSASDMPVVFETHQARTNAEGDQDRVRMGELFENNKEVRAMNGRLYRKVAIDAGQARYQGIFRRAFNFRKHDTFLDFGSSLSGATYFDGLDSQAVLDARSASRAIDRHLNWKMKCDAMPINPLVYAWPDRPPNTLDAGENPAFHREQWTFTDVAPKLSSFSEEDISYCRDLHKAQAAKFVVMEGRSIWMETTPPVYMVRYHWGALEGHGPATTLSMCHAPEWEVTMLTAQFFALNELEKAREYASELTTAIQASRGGLGYYLDNSVTHSVHDDGLFDFDHDADELRRMSNALAIENMGLLRKTEKEGRTLVSDTDPIRLSYEETRKTNHVLRDLGDASPWFLENRAVYKANKWPATQYSVDNRKIASMLLRRAANIEADKPIPIPFLAPPRVG